MERVERDPAQCLPPSGSARAGMRPECLGNASCVAILSNNGLNICLTICSEEGKGGLGEGQSRPSVGSLGLLH